MSGPQCRRADRSQSVLARKPEFLYRLALMPKPAVRSRHEFLWEDDMAVVVDEFTSVQPEPAAQRGTEESHEGGGDQGSSPEHDVTKVMEWQASRSERIRAY